MRLIESINQYIALFLNTFRRFGLGKAWLLLVFWFAVNWLVLYAHYDFLSPTFYGVVTTWLSIVKPLTGEATVNGFMYYPQHFFYIGEVFGFAKILLGLVFEGLILGAVARMFARSYDDIEQPVGSIWSRWGSLVVVWLIINALTYAAGYFLPQWFAPLLNGPRRLNAFVFVFMPFVFTVLIALLMYTVAFVAVYGDSALRAVGRSLRLFGRRPFTAFFLAAVILSVPLLLGAAAGRPSLVIETLRPEVVYWLLALGLLAEIVANFFWMGTTVRFIHETRE